AVGGLGTTYFTAKIGVAENRTHTAKLAVLPTIEVLSPGVVQGLAPGEHRVQLGLPVSGELDRGPLRLYGAAGYFTRGAWFTGAVANDASFAAAHEKSLELKSILQQRQIGHELRRSDRFHFCNDRRQLPDGERFVERARERVDRADGGRPRHACGRRDRGEID